LNIISIMSNEFQALLDLATTAVKTITESYAAANTPVPSLSDAATPFEPKVHEQPGMNEATEILKAACSSLIALATPPAAYTTTKSMEYNGSAYILVAIEAHVAEALRDAGSAGLPVEEIAKYSNICPLKLARALRYLATNHIFQEVSPNVFANNRTSVTLMKGKKTAEQLSKERPELWYEGSDGLAALMGHCIEMHMKSAAYLSESLQDPATGKSYSGKETALQKALNVNVGIFDVLEMPGGEHRRARFHAGMIGSTAFHGGAEGIDWVGLPAGSVCVDVGGGIGYRMLPVTKSAPHLKVIIQDQASMKWQADNFWKEKDADAMPSGRVKWMVHDFFKEQPIKGAAVYFLRGILHDWPDHDALTILKSLVEAAGPNSQIIITDFCPAFASRSEFADSAYKPPIAPAPLLPNYSDLRPYMADAMMGASYNSHERTFLQWRALIDAAGLKFNAITGLRPGLSIANLITSVR